MTFFNEQKISILIAKVQIKGKKLKEKIVIIYTHTHTQKQHADVAHIFKNSTLQFLIVVIGSIGK